MPPTEWSGVRPSSISEYFKVRVFSSRLPAFAVAALLLAPVAARADTASDLVAKNLAARGGAEKLAALASVRFTGKLIYPGDFELTYRGNAGTQRTAKRLLRIEHCKG